jgi:pyrroloquinoline-quinone synthase
MTLEQRLRAVGRERYHHLHPFHRLLHEGRLTRGQLQAWALNRFVYQAAIPRKDAALIARTSDVELRRAWRPRLADHDGEAPGEGGIARWLGLTDALGLDREAVVSHRGVLPATHFAVEAYMRFVAERPLLEAVASSLTELFAPDLIAQRIDAMLSRYPFVDERALAYFRVRLDQAPRDASFALAWVVERARTVEEQDAAVRALEWKCGMLWAQLDALHHAYVEPGVVPPGCFRPEVE